jgi:anti-sigma factor RsiW
MSGRVLKFDDSAHRNADLLLPWLVNGTLEGDELARVKRHVAECARCQRELALLRELRDACKVMTHTPEPDAPWHRLEPRLGMPAVLDGRAVASLRELRRRWRTAVPWARWGMAAELFVILALGAWLLAGPASENAYRTLGATSVPAATTGNVVVVFDQRSTESDMRRILRDTGAVRIDVPTETGAYVLHVPDDHAPAAIDRLRKEPTVVLVERLTAETGE